MRAPRRSLLVVLAASVAAAIAAPAGHGAATLPARFPAAGELHRAVAVRSAPSPSAPVVRTIRRFRPDGQFRIVLALSARRGTDRMWWYRLSLPGPPNGATGWVRADAVAVRPVVNRIVVRLGDRRLEVRRVRDGKELLRGMVAIGGLGSATPLGSFYVESGFVPTDPFYGSYALETTAFARVTDWPSNVVGIHGTDSPWLLGQAVSHGCVRVSNDVARRLRRLAGLGTPVDIVR
jgi:lipoprotein-anchoring transpeptidase ErfK/SrfK